MDFSGWFEVYLGGRWYTFDARHNVPRIGRVLMAKGRDAVDVALTTAFGTAELKKFVVWTDEVDEWALMRPMARREPEVWMSGSGTGPGLRRGGPSAGVIVAAAPPAAGGGWPAPSAGSGRRGGRPRALALDGVGAEPLELHRGERRHGRRRGPFVPLQRDPIDRVDLDGDGDRLLGAPLPDAAVGRDVGVVAADGRHDVVVAEELARGRVDVDPSGALAGPDLAPGVGGDLAGVVDVAADVPGRQTRGRGRRR